MSVTVLYAEVCIICILFLLLIALKARRSAFPQSQRQSYLAVCFTNMLLFVVDACWIFVDSDAALSSPALNWLLNGLYYILGCLVSYFWFCYSESVQQSRFARDRRWHLVAFAPALILIALTFLTYWTHWLFYVDAANQYHRGPAYLLQVVVTYGYVILTATKAYVLSNRTNDYARRMELRTLSTFVVPSVITGVFQVLFPRYPILCVGNTFGLLYVYLTLQAQLVSIDALTRLNNRNQLFQYLSVRLRRDQGDKPLYLLMIDVNKFKAINDTYGHIEGDKALRLVADALRKACSRRGFFIARYGGDEFTVICELDKDQSILDVHKRIDAALAEVETPYPLTVSIGSARYTSDVTSRQDLIARADEELYKAKAALAR
ncbi:MAG: diguanylate cyclase [Atopobiaceae bacterium]|jgi:diguanylate cyclase (GGDEF)-like protein|nr:diguanylate cyclase [Atopobiaceae bacterium]MCH4181534.1 diguanylate cyclase [Atopobiaceae bacterium]MCH4215132.1 diguanylate cyclase [Atopobiaceae bacterium]MCH4277251.1 diguanylate cyclase [Atopobiaceae bacterium]MCI1225904.1 diguanylate cyclase [Atopobiaceae bacterium]